MPRGKKTIINKPKWRLAISQAGGVVTVVANKLGVSRSTILRLRKEVPWVQEAFHDATAVCTDLAESVVLDELKKGNPKVAMWYLERKGKDRGFGREMKIETDSKLTNVTVYIPDNGRGQPTQEATEQS